MDFPDPDGPMIAVKAPVAKETSTPRSACTVASPPAVALRQPLRDHGGHRVLPRAPRADLSTGEGHVNSPCDNGH
ncbi:hypothetical protein GCM10018953_58900 [Streptosporangium nondiastaticum]